mgnify:CR=1 FL=1
MPIYRHTAAWYDNPPMFRIAFLRLILCASLAMSLTSCQMLGSVLKLPFSILGGLTGASRGLLGEADTKSDPATRAAEIESRGAYSGQPLPSILEADRVAMRPSAKLP